MSNIIVLKAYKSKKRPEIVCRPVQDSTGYVYTGQGERGYFEQLSEEEKRNMGFLVTPSTSVKLTDGQTLNLENPRDAINWKWLQKHPYIDLEKSDSPSNDAVFYVYDVQKTAQEKVSRTKRRYELIGKIFEMSEEAQRQLASALGVGDTSGLSIDQVISYLEDRVENNPGVVEPLVNDKASISVQALFKTGVNKSVIQKRGGWFKFEDVNLGNGEAQALEFLKDSENEDIVLAIRAQIDEVQ